MKKIFHPIWIALLYITFPLSGQQYTKVKYNLETPFTGKYTQERFKGDSIILKEYDENGKYENSSVLIYKRSKDRLRDTVFTLSGAMRTQEYIYSKDNQLLSIVNLVPNRNILDRLAFQAEGPQTNYQYRADGRIQSISILSNPGLNLKQTTVYDYINHTIITCNHKKEKTSSTKILFTDSGYITQSKDLSSHESRIFITYDTTEYVFDKENRLIKKIFSVTSDLSDIRKGTLSYSYTDSGYILSDKSSRIEHIYMKDGNKRKIVEQRFSVKDGWKPYHTTQIFTFWGKSNPHSSQIIPESPVVYSDGRSIVIKTLTPTKVAIYSFNGQMIKLQHMTAGTSHISMPTGVYLVSINGQGYKVAIR